MDKKEQLNRLRNSIDIRDYVRMMGYVIDKERDSTTYAAFKNDTTGDKIYVPQKRDIPNYYVNQYDDKDKGTTIDFIMTRQNKNLDEARIALLDFDGSKTISTNYQPKFNTQKKEQEEKKRKQLYVVNRITTENIDGRSNPYLEKRLLTKQNIYAPEFDGKILNNKFLGISNLAFPLINSQSKVVGYAFKGEGANNMIGERKGNWVSNPTNKSIKVDQVIIIEHPLNAISFKQLHDQENKINTVYMSTFGNPSNEQLTELSKTIKTISPTKIIIATDNDRGGEKIENRIKAQFINSDFPMQTIKSQFTDFNADLYALQIWKERLANTQIKNHELLPNKNKVEAPQFVLNLIDEKKYNDLDNKKIRNFYIVKKLNGKEIEFSFFELAKINNDKSLKALLLS